MPPPKQQLLIWDAHGQPWDAIDTVDPTPLDLPNRRKIRKETRNGLQNRPRSILSPRRTTPTAKETGQAKT